MSQPGLSVVKCDHTYRDSKHTCNEYDRGPWFPATATGHIGTDNNRRLVRHRQTLFVRIVFFYWKIYVITKPRTSLDTFSEREVCDQNHVRIVNTNGFITYRKFQSLGHCCALRTWCQTSQKGDPTRLRRQGLISKLNPRPTGGLFRAPPLSFSCDIF